MCMDVLGLVALVRWCVGCVGALVRWCVGALVRWLRRCVGYIGALVRWCVGASVALVRWFGFGLMGHALGHSSLPGHILH